MYAWGALVGTLMTEPCLNVHALQVKIPLPGTARVSEGDSGKEDGHNLSMFNPPPFRIARTSLQQTTLHPPAGEVLRP